MIYPGEAPLQVPTQSLKKSEGLQSLPMLK